MLETGHAALLPEPTKNAGLIRDPDIAEFIRDITDKYLRVGKYDPESMTSCLEFTKVLDTSDKLCEYMDAFEVEVYEKRFMTFDFEFAFILFLVTPMHNEPSRIQNTGIHCDGINKCMVYLNLALLVFHCTSR